MKPTKIDKLDFVSSGILTLFGIGVFIESLRMPRLENLNISPYTVPGLVPGVLGILLTLGGLFILVRSVMHGGWRLGLTGNSYAIWAKSSATRRSVMTLGLTLFYALILFPFVPFYVATPLFVFAFILGAEAMALGALPKMRAIISGLILAVLAGFIIGYVFQELFYVQLPGDK